MSRRLLAALLFLPLAASATVVTTTTDEDDGSLGGGKGISLREAVKYSPAGTSISFAPALSGQTIRLTLGEISITHPLTISGSALPVKITISGDRSGNGKSPDDTNVFRAGGGRIIFDSLIISGGYGSAGGAILSNIDTADLIVSDCHFTGNSTDAVGGAIFFSKNTGAGTPRLLIKNSTFTGNSSGNDGGAIYAVYSFEIQNTTFTGNSSRQGGAIFAVGFRGPSARLKNTTVTGNSADYGGGGIYIYNSDLRLENSTVSGNSATLFDGGGIYVEGGSAVLENTTIANNTATGDGGGIYLSSGLYSFTFLRTQNATIAANTAGNSGGGIQGDAFDLSATIVSGNTAPIYPDVTRVPDTGGNLITPVLSLAPLGNYGGPTQTMPPFIGSPAIDPTSSPSWLNLDQRGFTRRGPRDIGAAEYQGSSYQYDDAAIIYQHIETLWNVDADRDGLPYAIERLHGTNPFLPDIASPATLSAPLLENGTATLTFIGSRNAYVPEVHTFWYLMRSPDLSPGSWSEIYRFNEYGSSSIPGVSFTLTPGVGESIRVTVTDENPLPGGGYYRFEAKLGF